MNDVKFPALVGDSPLAILAAIGTLRLIHDFVDNRARLSWDAVDRAPVLRSSMPSVDDIVERITEIIKSMPKGVVVPGGPPDFPPPGGAPDRLRVELGQLRCLADDFGKDPSSTPVAGASSWVPQL